MKVGSIRNHVFMTLVCMLVSCSSKDVEDPVANGEVQKIIVSVRDYINGDKVSESRTYFNPSDYTYSWLTTDTIGIFPERGDQLPFGMASGAGASTATISGGSWGLKTTEQYAAYYPFSRQNYFTDRGHIQFSYVGQGQTGIGDDGKTVTAHLSAFDLMAADNASTDGNYLHFDFKHLGCIFNLKITVPYAGTYSAVTLTSDEAVFATKVNLDLTQTTAEVTTIETSKSISVTLNDFTTPSDNYLAMVYLMCAPCDLQGKTITLKLKSANGYTYSCDKTFTRVYSAGNYYGFTFKSLTQDSTPSIGIGGEFETTDEEM